MFIIHGTKTVRRKLGRVADFCEQCQTVRACKVKRIGHAAHIYFIALSKGELIGFERTCEECGNLHELHRHRYKGFVNDKEAALEDLIEQTNPDLLQRLADRLDAEAGVASERVIAEQRRERFAEIFYAANALLNARRRETHFDKTSGIAILATIVLTALVRIIGGDTQDAFITTAITGSVGAIICIVLLGTDVSRYSRRVLAPYLLMQTIDLEPSLAELEELAEEDKIVRKVAKWVPLHLLAMSDHVQADD